MNIRTYLRGGMLLGALLVTAPGLFAQKGLKNLGRRMPVAPRLEARVQQQVVAHTSAVALQKSIEVSTAALLEQASFTNSALHRPNFAKWMKLSAKNHYFSGSSTFQALKRVNTLLENAQQKHQMRPLRKLLKEISYYRNILGRQGDYFYKLFYKTEAEFTGVPRAENFFLLAERHGFENTSPELLRARELSQQHTSVFLSQSPDRAQIDGKWTNLPYTGTIHVKANAELPVVRQELEAMLDALTPPGFAVRIHQHELGIRTLPSGAEDRSAFRQGGLHVHFEFIPPEDLSKFFVQTSIDFWLNLQEFTVEQIPGQAPVPLSDRNIAQTYLYLFHKYITLEKPGQPLLYRPCAQALLRIIQGK